MMASDKSTDPKACQSEVRDVFDKLRSLREESHRQFSDIIDCHSSSISKRINDLVEEVCDLRDELAVVKKEKSVLIETVDNLNGEIRQLSAKLTSVDHSSEAEESLAPIIKEEGGSAMDISVEMGKVPDSACDDAHNVDALTIEQVQEESIQDRVMTHGDSYSSPNTDQGNDKSDYDEEANCDTVTSDGLVCPECNFEFSTNENLRIHLKNVHSKMGDGNVLPEDDHPSREKPAPSQKGALKNHITQKHGTGDKKFKCDICPYVTNRSDRLSYHNYSIHKIGTGYKKFKCDICPYVTNRSDRLSYHNYSIHKIGTGDKNFKCDICPYVTNRSDRLSYHNYSIHKIGTGDKKFKCDICPYVTNRSDSLSYHNYSIHKIKTRGTKYECKLCSFTTVKRVRLMTHNYSIHKIGDTKFVCEMCPYKTYDKSSLKRHEETMHGTREKKFKCDLCPYVTHTTANLRRHVQTMHGKRDKQYKCDVCAYETHSKDCLRKHVKNIHSIKV